MFDATEGKVRTQPMTTLEAMMEIYRYVVFKKDEVNVGDPKAKDEALKTFVRACEWLRDYADANPPKDK